jgi:hypothetical protein
MTDRRFEYLVVNYTCHPDSSTDQMALSDKLDQFGNVGWELVSVTPSVHADKDHRLFFKRPRDWWDGSEAPPELLADIRNEA